MDISLNGFANHSATLKKSGTINKGDIVAFSGNGTVKAATASSKICGVASDINGDYVTVIFRGYVTVVYTGTTAPTVGFCSLCADGSGAVKVDSTNGAPILVCDVDTTAKTAGILL